MDFIKNAEAEELNKKKEPGSFLSDSFFQIENF